MTRTPSVPRIPYGHELGVWRGIALVMPECGDCGTTAGKLHESGCDIERCARCAGQKISCWCGTEGQTDVDPEVYVRLVTEEFRP